MKDFAQERHPIPSSALGLRKAPDGGQFSVQLASSPRQRAQRLVIDRSLRIQSHRRVMQAEFGDVAQRLVPDDLPNGKNVRVTDKHRQDFGKVGTIVGRSDRIDGYLVRFGNGLRREFEPAELSFANLESETDITEDPWSEGEARGLALVARNLLSFYPPKEHAYLMLGNSPALLTEYLMQESQAKEPDVTLLPFSLSGLSTEDYLESVEAELDGQQVTGQQRISTYLSRYVAPAALKGKIPLVIDLTASGQSLAVISVHLRRYYASVGAKAAANSLRVASLGSGEPREVSVDKGLLKEQPEEEDAPFVSQVLGSHREQDIPVGEIGQLDPEREAEAFTNALLTRRFKDGFGYKTFERAEYGDILRGETTESVPDVEGIARTRRAVSAIRRSL